MPSPPIPPRNENRQHVVDRADVALADLEFGLGRRVEHRVVTGLRLEPFDVEHVAVGVARGGDPLAVLDIRAGRDALHRRSDEPRVARIERRRIETGDVVRRCVRGAAHEQHRQDGAVPHARAVTQAHGEQQSLVLTTRQVACSRPPSAILVISSTLAFAAAVACSSSNSGKADAAVDAFSSTCGHPGDMGNDQGVGKFCRSRPTARGRRTRACARSSAMRRRTSARTSARAAARPNQCGSDAMCTCNSSNQCGCTPNACLTGP